MQLESVGIMTDVLLKLQTIKKGKKKKLPGVSVLKGLVEISDLSRGVKGCADVVVILS